MKEIDVRGRHLAEGVPRSFTLTNDEILTALEEPLEAIMRAVKQALEQSPPELAADIAESGIVLTGGGALLTDLDHRISNETGLPVVVAEDPLTCVARGGGKALELMDRHVLICSQPNKTGDWGSVIKPLFLKQNPMSARFIVLTLLCLSILFIFRDHPRVTAVQRGAVDAVAFTSNTCACALDAWDRMLESVQSRNALQDEVLRLQQETRVLKGQAQRLASLLSENARYKALLNSARDIEDELIAAQISSVSPDPARHMVMLDKGAADGVEEGQPVLGAEGLIGQIVLVGEYNSRALLITDSAHALPVQVNRSRLRAIAEGSGDIDRLVIGISRDH